MGMSRVREYGKETLELGLKKQKQKRGDGSQGGKLWLRAYGCEGG